MQTEALSTNFWATDSYTGDIVLPLPKRTTFFLYIFRAASVVLTALSLYSHMQTMMTDPHVIPATAKPLTPDQQARYPHRPPTLPR